MAGSRVRVLVMGRGAARSDLPQCPDAQTDQNQAHKAIQHSRSEKLGLALVHRHFESEKQGADHKKRKAMPNCPTNTEKGGFARFGAPRHERRNSGHVVGFKGVGDAKTKGAQQKEQGFEFDGEFSFKNGLRPASWIITAPGGFCLTRQSRNCQGLQAPKTAFSP